MYLCGDYFLIVLLQYKILWFSIARFMGLFIYCFVLSFHPNNPWACNITSYVYWFGHFLWTYVMYVYSTR